MKKGIRTKNNRNEKYCKDMDLIIRVVKRGETEEPQKEDYEGPSDLVAILKYADGTQEELDRKQFDDFRGASDYLAGLVGWKLNRLNEKRK